LHDAVVQILVQVVVHPVFFPHMKTSGLEACSFTALTALM
jgi:heme/copper-type cytochrome/quinol oxidase subunit 4